jgi:adenylate cyclase
MVELERTYLAAKLPANLSDLKQKDILDIYVPHKDAHPSLRIRKRGDTYEITKTRLVNEGDSSQQLEETIVLTPEEYADLAEVSGKRVHKIRHYLPYEGKTAEVDVFQDNLKGLVLIDFEFDSIAEKDAFAMPDFCLTEITQEHNLAGGMLCGKSYADITSLLDTYGYKPL